MNKPATKEPSMDEILSSIRQIIADDDAAATPVPARPSLPSFPPAADSPPKPPAAAVPARPEPLTLSPAQMLPPAAAAGAPPPRSAADFSAMLQGLGDTPPETSPPIAEILADEPELIDPEDVTFEAEPEPPPPVAPAPSMVARAPEPPRAEPPRPRPMASVAQAAPMPDPRLSEDMAEQLLAPATNAAVTGTMSRLSAMTSGGIGGMTVEAMIREMLKPMLKDWLDENLPALVERVVEKEIARISRGVK